MTFRYECLYAGAGHGVVALPCGHQRITYNSCLIVSNVCAGVPDRLGVIPAAPACFSFCPAVFPLPIKSRTLLMRSHVTDIPRRTRRLACGHPTVDSIGPSQLFRGSLRPSIGNRGAQSQAFNGELKRRESPLRARSKAHLRSRSSRAAGCDRACRRGSGGTALRSGGTCPPLRVAHA